MNPFSSFPSIRAFFNRPSVPVPGEADRSAMDDNNAKKVTANSHGGKVKTSKLLAALSQRRRVGGKSDEERFEEAGGRTVMDYVVEGKYKGYSPQLGAVRLRSLHYRDPNPMLGGSSRVKNIFKGLRGETAKELAMRFMNAHGFRLCQHYDKPITFFIGNHIPDAWEDAEKMAPPNIMR